jgi:hypothetical protein
MTKKQIDEAILGIQKQIFDIEQNRLQPAQEQIRLLEIQKTDQLAAIAEQEQKWTDLDAQVQSAITAGYDLEAAYKAAAAAAASIKIGATNVSPADSSNAPGSNASSGSAAKGGSSSGSSSSSSSGSSSKSSSSASSKAPVLTAAQKATIATNTALDTKISGLKFEMQTAQNKLAAAEVAFDVKSNQANLDKVNGLKYTVGQIAQSISMVNNQKGVVRLATGGMVPKYFASGGFSVGTDTVPAMLTPGEFVMTKHAVDNFGVDNLRAINNGSSVGDSVYNYSLSVNMSGSNLSPNDVARAVMTQIKQIDSQRLRGNRL